MWPILESYHVHCCDIIWRINEWQKMASFQGQHHQSIKLVRFQPYHFSDQYLYREIIAVSLLRIACLSLLAQRSNSNQLANKAASPAGKGQLKTILYERSGYETS